MIWTNHYFGPLGILEIVGISFSMLITLISFIIIILDSKCLLIILLITILISSIFTFIISIFLFIGTQVRYWNESLGCHTQYKGLYQAWKSVDIYLQSVDETLCSIDCPCYFNRTTTMKYLNNPNINFYYNNWYVRNVSIDALRIQDCNKSSRKKSYNNYLMRNAYYNYTLNTYWFDWYFSKVEKYFKCTGFCGLTYYNENMRTNAKIVKYLFSDLSKVPENFGCLDSFIHWLQRMMNSVGSFFVIIFFFQIILCCVILCMIIKGNNSNYDIDNGSENDIEEKIELNNKIDNSIKDNNKNKEYKGNEKNDENLLLNSGINSSKISDIKKTNDDSYLITGSNIFNLGKDNNSLKNTQKIELENLKKDNENENINNLDNNLIQKFNNEKEISLINDSQYIQDINDYTNAPKLKKIKKKSQNKKEVNEDKKHIVFNPSNNA